MEPVKVLQGNEFTKGNGTLKEDVTKFFQSLGGKVFNNRLGDVILNKKGVKNDLAHGMTNEKAAAFAAVPDVIKNGSVVAFEKNWKGRGYDTATIVAPVAIDGEAYMMVVIANRSSGENRFYLHDVYAESMTASSFDSANFAYGNDADTKGGPFNQDPSAHATSGTPGGPTSTVNIIQEILDVKRGNKKGVPQVNDGKPRADIQNDTADTPDAGMAGSAPNVNSGVDTGIQGTGAAEANFAGTREYDLLLSDENAQRDRKGDVRPVEVPKVDARGKKVSEFVGNAYGSALTPDQFVPTIRKMVMDGSLSHDVQSNRETLSEAAVSITERGIIGSIMDVREEAAEKKVSPGTIAKAELLYHHLVQSENAGDQQAAADIFVSLSEMATTSGRALQLYSLFRRMTPDGMTAVIKQEVERSIARLQRQGLIKKDYVPDVDPYLLEGYRKAAEELRRASGSRDTDGAKQELTRALDAAAKAQAEAETAGDRVADLEGRLSEAKERAREARREADKLDRKAERLPDRIEAETQRGNEEEDRLRFVETTVTELQEQLDLAKERAREARRKADNAERRVETARKKLDKLNGEIQDAPARREAAEKKLNEIQKAIYQAEAAKAPVTFKAKWDAWRYMAMLGNVKTQLRNVGGNFLMMPYTDAKRLINAGLERVLLKQENRRSAVMGLSENDRALMKWAKADAKTGHMKDVLSGSAKLGDASDTKKLSDSMRIFKNGWLEGSRKLVNGAVEGGDMWFKNREYTRSLSGYLKARGCTAADVQAGKVSDTILDEARAFAVSEAMRATFNDCNAFSDALSNMRFKDPDNAVKKAMNMLGEGVLPFRKTPANIVARFTEYSPVGLAKGAWDAAAKVHSGKISAAAAIDELSAGLTGSAAMLFGALLAKGILGVKLTGSGVSEDEERQGHQEYALEFSINGEPYSYKIDWAAPANLPLFLGANLYDLLSGEDGDVTMSGVTSWVYAAQNMLEPMLSLSCLSSLNDLVETARYAGEGEALYAIAASMATSYFTQGIPSLLRQAARAAQKTNRQTFANSEDTVVRGIQRTVANIPIVGEMAGLKTDRVSEWGEIREAGDGLLRALNAFVNPGTGKKIDNGPVEQEITRLSGAGYDVTPPTVGKTVSYTDSQGVKQDRRLTEAEYTTLRTEQGKTAKTVFSGMLRTGGYQKLTDAQKEKAVNLAYKYAQEQGKKAAFSDYYSTAEAWISEVAGDPANGIVEKVISDTLNEAVSKTISDIQNGFTGSSRANDKAISEAYDVYASADKGTREAIQEAASGSMGLYLTARDENIIHSKAAALTTAVATAKGTGTNGAKRGVDELEAIAKLNYGEATTTALMRAYFEDGSTAENRFNYMHDEMDISAKDYAAMARIYSDESAKGGTVAANVEKQLMEKFGLDKGTAKLIRQMYGGTKKPWEE